MPRKSPTLAVLALSLLLGAGPVYAANAVEAARSEAKAARSKLFETKGRQQSLRAELNQVSGRIEAMKAKGQTFLQNPELDAELRRSQELAASLTELAQSMSGLEAKAQAAASTLLTVVNDELGRLRNELERSTDRNARKALINQIRALRAEREQLRAQLPATAVPALNDVGSDDPEELLEQADALRDSEDKVRSQMKQLQARLQEVKDEQELDRSIDDFSRDDAMFDDTDRRLRLTKSQSTRLTVERAPPLDGEFKVQADAAAPAMTSGGAPEEGSRTVPDQQAGNPGDREFNQTARAADALPQVGKVGTSNIEGDDVQSLEAQLKKLQQRAEDLKARAAQLEKKATDAQ